MARLWKPGVCARDPGAEGGRPRHSLVGKTVVERVWGHASSRAKQESGGGKEETLLKEQGFGGAQREHTPGTQISFICIKPWAS